jgi:hypothetical protein
MFNAPAWTVRRTFVELEEDTNPEIRVLTRSNSDSQLSSSLSSSGKSASVSSSQNHEIVKSPPLATKELLTHLTWQSSSESGAEGSIDVDKGSGIGSGIEGSIDVDKALALHEQIWDLCESGLDLRDVLVNHFPDVDLQQYVPRDPATGELTSLGSVRHLIGDCQRCYFIIRNSCRKGMKCLYCHAPHDETLKTRGKKRSSVITLKPKSHAGGPPSRAQDQMASPQEPTCTTHATDPRQSSFRGGSQGYSGNFLPTRISL